jgi:hypothetical protein
MVADLELAFAAKTRSIVDVTADRGPDGRLL